MLAVVIPILISILSAIPCFSLFQNPDVILISHAYAVFLVFLQSFLTTHMEKLKKDAAYIQLKFDLNVFNLKWNENIFGPETDDEDLVIKEYKKFSKKDLASLNNWYDLSKLKGRKKEVVIRLCQRQNLGWNSTIFKRINIGINALIWGSFVVFVFIIPLFKLSMAQMINSAVNFIPLITWILAFNKNYEKNKTILDELKNLIDKNKYSNIFALAIEAKFTKYRQNDTLIPDWYYRMFREKDNKIQQATQIFTINDQKSQKK